LGLKVGHYCLPIHSSLRLAEWVLPAEKYSIHPIAWQAVNPYLNPQISGTEPAIDHRLMNLDRLIG
jgi:hypothetical protein